MSAKAAAATPPATEAPKPKGKGKLLVIVLALVVCAAGGGGGAWYFLNKKAAGAEHEEAEAKPAEPKHAAPTYMALENMVVNLADDGGERFAQIGITLDLQDEKTAEKVKTLLPSVRSKVLMLVSQRSSAELLKRDGKEKLADDIAVEVGRALGHEPEAVEKVAKGEAPADEVPEKKKKKKPSAPSPVNGVLFSSFIVQ